MKKSLVLAALSCVAIVAMALHAGASLVAMSWGYPQMTQSNTLTAFEKDTSSATDDSAAAVSFPTTASDLTDSTFGSSFPTISQTEDQSQLLSSIKFQNEASNMSFAYPFLSIGGSSIPSMGLF